MRLSIVLVYVLNISAVLDFDNTGFQVLFIFPAIC